MAYALFDPLNALFHIVSWILFVWFIIWLIRGSRRHHHGMFCGRDCMHPMHGGRALDLLKERFAKGEINKEEYQEKKRVLSE